MMSNFGSDHNYNTSGFSWRYTSEQPVPPRLYKVELLTASRMFPEGRSYALMYFDGRDWSNVPERGVGYHGYEAPEWWAEIPALM